MYVIYFLAVDLHTQFESDKSIFANSIMRANENKCRTKFKLDFWVSMYISISLFERPRTPTIS